MFPQLAIGALKTRRYFTAIGSLALASTDISGVATRSIFATGSITLGSTDISGAAIRNPLFASGGITLGTTDISGVMALSWTPKAGTLRAWWDASDVSTQTYSSGTNITALNDKSTSGMNFTNVFGSPNYLPNTQNGLGVINFDGIDDVLSCRSGSVVANGGYMAAVVLSNPVADDGISVGWGQYSVASNYGFLTPNRSDLANAGLLRPSDGFIIFDLPFQSFGFDIYLFGFDSVTSSVFYSINGGPLAIVSGQTAFSGLDLTALGALVRDLNPSGAAFSSFLFGEMFSYGGNFVADTTLQDKVAGYLAHKWGIASKLPIGHPYKFTPPTT